MINYPSIKKKHFNTVRTNTKSKLLFLKILNFKRVFSLHFLLVFVLIITGIFFIANASSPLAQARYGDKLYFIRQHIIWSILGIIIIFVISKINYLYWKKWVLPIFFLGILVCAFVLVPGIGVKLLGARRWINFFGLTNFQPSELLKMSLIMYLAKAADQKKKLSSFLFAIFISISVVMLQPDLGTSLILAGSSIVQIFLSGIGLLPLIILLSGGLISGSVLVLFSDYRKARLLSFLNIDSPASYHIKQVLLAIGSGKLFGVGFGQSRQKYLFIPESASDSIFAIIAEEMGFIKTLFLIFVILILFIVLIKKLFSVKDTFGLVLGGGIIAWIALQTIINLFSMLAIIPITGVPMPFFSYGGTSMIMICAGLGILFNIIESNEKNK